MVPDGANQLSAEHNESDGKPIGPSGSVHTEELHLRSYAHEWSYDLELEVSTPDGEVVFEKQYYVRPGRAASETGAIDPGEYDVRAVLDGEREAVRRCQIDRTPEGTVVVEVGNGILSLTEGLRVR